MAGTGQDGLPVARLVETLTRRIAPAASSGAAEFAMRILGSMLRSPEVAALDEGTVCDAVARALSEQGGDVERFQTLRRRFLSLELYRHKADLLYLLLLLNEDRGTSREGLELVRPLPATLSSAIAPSAAQLPRAAPLAVPSTAGRDSSGGGGGGGAPRSEMGVAPAPPDAAQARKFKHFSVDGTTSFEVSEQLLVRDMVYVFQGIDGAYVKFDASRDVFAVVPGAELPPSTRTLVSQLGEMGWLYRKVSGVMERSLARESLGRVGQGFCFALQDELTDYFKLLAVLEAQINHGALERREKRHEDGPPSGGHASSTLTLRRLLVWTQDPLQRLRLMATLADSVEGLRGGALVSAVAMHGRHGDPFVHHFVEQVLRRLAAPLFEMIQKWVLEGALNDEFGEFFVEGDSGVSADRLWRDKYCMRDRMVPSFIGEDLARKILQIGKSINFIRHCCDDSEWITGAGSSAVGRAGAVVGDATSGEGDLLEFDQTEQLQALVDRAAEAANRRLVRLLHEKYNLMEHCSALKRYVLLAQGDFAQQLMNEVGHKLDEPASKQFHHNLVASLEAAVRSSNAQYERKDIISRLDIKLMEPSPGDDGWDIFSLLYHIDTPINAVITDEAAQRYLQVFGFLWRLKRVEWSLCETWSRQMTATHHLGRSQPQLRHALHRCHVLRHDMLHTVSTLSNYMMFEVIETSWVAFTRAVAAAMDMDALIAAHEAFLSSVMERGLMSGATEVLKTPLNMLFDDVLHFVRVQEQLYTDAQAEVAAQRRAKASVAERIEAVSNARLAVRPPLMCDSPPPRANRNNVLCRVTGGRASMATGRQKMPRNASRK